MYFVSLHLCHIQIHCVRQIIQICNQIIIDHIIIYLFTCLDEYVTVMQPVALALDKLQGQNDVFFGHILPTLYTVQVKLTGMQQKALKHSEALVKTLLEGLAKRFDKELSFSSGDKIIATVTHPFTQSNSVGFQRIKENSVVSCLLKQLRNLMWQPVHQDIVMSVLHFTTLLKMTL